MEAAERDALFDEIEREASSRGWYGLTPARPGRDRVFTGRDFVVSGLIGIVSMIVTRAVRLWNSLSDPSEDFLSSFFAPLSDWPQVLLVAAIGLAAFALTFLVLRAFSSALNADLTAPVERRAVIAVETRSAGNPRSRRDGIVLLEERDGSQTEYHAHRACLERVPAPTSGFAYIAHHRLLDFKTLSPA